MIIKKIKQLNKSSPTVRVPSSELIDYQGHHFIAYLEMGNIYKFYQCIQTNCSFKIMVAGESTYNYCGKHNHNK